MAWLRQVYQVDSLLRSEGRPSCGRIRGGPPEPDPTAAALRRSRHAAAQAKDEDSDEEAEAAWRRVALQTANRGMKKQLVAEFLCRWWYALPDWPPQEEEYYAAKLKERSLRRVPVEMFEFVDDVDEGGFRKVYELSQFRGVYRNSKGEGIDLRPQETCPCYNNMIKKSVQELRELLVTAYQNQIRDLENSTYDESHLRAHLQARLSHWRRQAHHVRLPG